MKLEYPHVVENKNKNLTAVREASSWVLSCSLMSDAARDGASSLSSMWMVILLAWACECQLLCSLPIGLIRRSKQHSFIFSSGFLGHRSPVLKGATFRVRTVLSLTWWWNCIRLFHRGRGGSRERKRAQRLLREKSCKFPRSFTLWSAELWKLMS